MGSTAEKGLDGSTSVSVFRFEAGCGHVESDRLATGDARRGVGCRTRYSVEDRHVWRRQLWIVVAQSDQVPAPDEQTAVVSRSQGLGRCRLARCDDGESAGCA